MKDAPIALTCGEPAGIGPEIAEFAWQELRRELCFFWIGDIRHLPGSSPAREITHPGQSFAVMQEALPVLPLHFNAARQAGSPQASHAQHVITSIEMAVDLVKQGEAAAICTSPIHKAALQKGAGFAFPGHTEFLAHLAQTPKVAMMLAAPELRVVPATTHIALAEVTNHLSVRHLQDIIRITQNALHKDFGIRTPRLAVAGLNPHAGEEGRMGREEIEWIAPLLADLRRDGSQIIGPVPADTLFHPAARQNYDAVIAMYHDQALIPIKTIAFDYAVNITLGLPFIRTSPDHGTAFDIAGRGVAKANSLIEALRMAARMAKSNKTL